MYDPYEGFVKRYLNNGVPVYILHEPGRQFELVNFMFQAGARDEVAVPAGTAHFLEHMICANCGKSMNQLQQYFGSVGGFFTAVTGSESTRYGFKAPVAAALFDDRLDFMIEACFGRNPTDHFDREKIVIASEIRQRYPTLAVMDMVKTVNQLHFRGTAMSSAPSAAGTLESLAAITLADVHHFRETYYSANNVTIICVGGLSPDEVVEKLQRTQVAQSVKGDRNPLPALMNRLPLLEITEVETVLSTDEVMGLTTLTYKTLLPESVSLAVAGCVEDVLADLLFEEVREKRGLSYSVGARAHTLGPFHELNVYVNDFPTERIAEVTDVVAELLQSFVSEENLFIQKKREILAGFKTRDENLQKIWSGASNELGLLGRIKTVVEEVAEFEAVHCEDMSQVAEQLWLPNNVLKVVAHR